MKLINPDPEQRPTAEIALHHEWFSNDKYALNSLLMRNEQLCLSPTFTNTMNNSEHSDFTADLWTGTNYFLKDATD